MLRAVVFAARLDFDIDQPILDAMEVASPRDRQGGAAAAGRGVLQDPAVGLRGEELPAAEGDAAAPRDHAGARRGRPGAVGVDRAPGSLSPALRVGARHLTNAILVGTLLAPLGLTGGRALLGGSAGAPRRPGHPADAATRRRAAAPDPDPAVAAASICGPRSRRSAACSIVTSSTTRSPGSRSTASAPRCWRTGARSRPSRGPARRCRTGTPPAPRCRRSQPAPPPAPPPALAVRRPGRVTRARG